MKYHELDAIVLKRHNFGEADRIITFFSPQMGKTAAVARGVRKIKSRLAGNLEPFIAIELRLVKGKGGLDTVIGARANQVFKVEQLGYDAVRAGWFMMEITERSTAEHQVLEGVYELLLECFVSLAEAVPPTVVTQYFCFCLLDTLGYLPEVPISGQGNDLELDLEHGTFSNQNRGLVSIPISARMLKLWKLCQMANLSDVARVKEVLPLSKKAQAALLQFYQYRFGIEFKSLVLL